MRIEILTSRLSSSTSLTSGICGGGPFYTSIIIVGAGQIGTPADLGHATENHRLDAVFVKGNDETIPS